MVVLRSDGSPVRPHVTSYPSPGRVIPARRRGAASADSSSANPPQAASPAYLQQAYDLNYLSQTAGTGDTVAIVDAYDDPTAESDLATYRSTYRLGACTTANGCFQKVGQDGTSSLPAPDASWEQEISLDLDAVSAVCPRCHILLVEANSNSFSDLEAAMQTAAKLGANQISASWGGTSSAVPSMFRTFSGVATVAATGDYGYLGTNQDEYPAALPGVTAAGGTSLAPATTTSARGFGEAAWSWNGLTGGGSGCDLRFQRPIYQPAAGCAGRAYADLSADADPNTGLFVYDNGSWSMFGGTSLSTPLIAAYYAVTRVPGATPQWAYGASGSLNDVLSGSTGNCAPSIAYICDAARGYDGPTGVGSISGSVVTGAPGIGGPAIVTGSGDNTYTASTRSDGATIAGGIYPNGLDTSWWIEYWPASGGSVQQTPAADVGSGTTPVTVTGYPSHVASNTQYDYRLVATNSAGTIYGYTYKFTTAVTSSTTPAAAFTSSPTPSTPGSAVGFDATSSTDSGATINDYSWDFGDGATQDAGSTPKTSHTYTSPGRYRVTLIVTNTNRESETTTQTATVDAPPTASFTTSPTFKTPASFDASGSSDSVGTITGYSWDFGDPGSADNTATGSNPTHTYATRGGHPVKLTVTNDAGQTDTTTQTVTVDDRPTATLSPSTTLTTPGSTVSFSSVAASPDPGGSIAGYSWDFGDPNSADNTATGPSADHTYASPGTYRVTVTATDDLGVSTTKTGQVTVDAPPTASFTASSTQPSPGSGVSFDASGSSDSVGTITGYSWDFGDPGSADNTATGPNPTHTFAARGRHRVKLTVTNDAGQTDTSTQPVTVDDPPTATLSPSTTLTTPGSRVSFSSVAASPDPGGLIAGYSWDFGDPGSAGNTATGQNADHAYAAPGTYRVTVTATDDLGVSTTKTGQVTVDAPPMAAFTMSPNPVTAGSAVAFDASGSSDSVGAITGYSWDFGDPGSADNTATSRAANHLYGIPGTYTVSLTVTNDAGQRTTRTASVTVNSVPVLTQPSPPPAPVPSPAPTPAPAPTPTPTPAPGPAPLTASLGAAKKQKLASVLPHGLRISLAVSQGTTASFQVTLPVRKSKLARPKAKTSAIVLLRTRPQTLRAGTHPITLKLSRGAARQLAARGPLVLTVRVTLTTAAGGTLTRSVNITLTR